ncbi:Collagenase [Papilio xuthus]|uniref:Collagenase n=1 Tax=Papilio xuthus TaxID=66420 RepID=A0A194PGK4_PAPXU|nr:Collagenase [Papilio xuthus]
MKLLFTFLASLVVVNCYVTDVNSEINGVYNYLNTTGVLEAERIRRLENEVENSGQRIVGGSPSNGVPNQVGLIVTLRDGRQAVCGGVIYADNRILTAAHCTNDGVNIARSVTVVAGSNFLFSGGTRIEAQSVVIHPGYVPGRVAFDLAILHIPRLTYSDDISPAFLPWSDDINNDFVGQSVRASGYGITRDGDTITTQQPLRSVNLRVISNAECRSTYGNVIQDHHLCTSGAGGVGICAGDTGGPLVIPGSWRDTLIGVGSFTAGRGCQAGAPSGFIRVTSFIGWIMGN